MGVRPFAEPHSIQDFCGGYDARDAGWYDVILMPVEPKRQFHFKEGDVAVLSTPKPGIGKGGLPNS